MKISTSSGILVVVIVSMILGLILRLLLVVTLPTTWDGGTFLYWANLLNNGQIPYRNFFIRDPVYIYLIAISTQTFGISIPALSIASVVPSILTVPLLYRISREIFDRLTGLVSALIFSFSPTVVWYSTVFDERSLMLFLSVLGMWALVRYLRTGNTRFLVLFGLIIGVGTFAYRALAIYAVALPLFLALLTHRGGFSLRDASKRLALGTILSWGSFFIAFSSIFLLFSNSSSFEWMVSNFGFGGQAESAGSFITSQTSISFKDRIFFVAVREWLYLLVPALVFPVVILFRKLSNRVNLALGITMVGSAAFLVATLAWRTADPQSSFGAYDPSIPYLYAFLAFLVVLPGTAAVTYRRISRPISYKGSMPVGWALLIFWFLSTVVLVALFGHPLVNYYYYFAPILTLLASPVISQAIRQIGYPTHNPLSRMMGHRIPILFLAVLLANAGMTAAMLYTTQMSWRNQSLSSIYDVASYIQAKTNPQDEILVGNPAIATLAQRKTALGITELQLYAFAGPEPFVPVANDPFHLFPNVTEISRFMASGGVKYVVADQSPPTLYIIGLHPLWKTSFLNNFVLETLIDGVSIYRYNPIWDLSQHLDAVEAFNNSTVYSYTYQAFVDGFGHLLISSWHPSLQPVGGTILSNQVLFHPPYVSGNSYIQIGLPTNKYTNLTTSFALADGAVGKSSGVTYSVQVRERTQQLFLLNRLVTTNSWQQFSNLLPTGPDLTIVLSSSSGTSSSYDWLQVTLTLY